MKKAFLISALVIAALGIISAGYLINRYKAPKEMNVEISELSNFQYDEDPSNRSVDYQRYNNRKLKLVKKDATHFNFIFDSESPEIAEIVLKNIDLSLFVTAKPKWVKDKGNELIAFTDREWNRQQVRFFRDSPELEVSGGDGFELDNLFSVELAKNCLNAGLWEIILTKKDNGEKAMYYHGWFTFPLGHYKNIFEKLSKTSYWDYAWRLEHWVNPKGAEINLNELRNVESKKKIEVEFLADEKVFVAGEQSRKLRTLKAENIRTWKDFFDERSIQFATFIPPGIYKTNVPWKNEYWRFATLTDSYLSKVKVAKSEELFDELELHFEDSKTKEISKFIVSGFKLSELPMLEAKDYPLGLYMPMGIAVPPFYQNYSELLEQSPLESKYFSMLLTKDDHWLNHHDIALDGPVLHRDMENPNLLHLYLLSYERHSLIGHFVIDLEKD